MVNSEKWLRKIHKKGRGFKPRTEILNYFLNGITTSRSFSLFFMTSRKTRYVTFHRISFHLPQAHGNRADLSRETRAPQKSCSLANSFGFLKFCQESFRTIYCHVYMTNQIGDISEVGTERTHDLQAIVKYTFLLASRLLAFWTFPSSSIVKNKTFRKQDLFPSSSEG
jgi:hypothetical protein